MPLYLFGFYPNGRSRILLVYALSIPYYISLILAGQGSVKPKFHSISRVRLVNILTTGTHTSGSGVKIEINDPQFLSSEKLRNTTYRANFTVLFISTKI